MQTFTYNFQFKQGANLDTTLTYKAGPNQAPVDLTGCTAWFVVRLKNAAQTKVLELTTENGGIALGGTAGTIRLTADRPTTKKFVWDEATHTLHIQYPSTFVHRLIEGEATVSHCND